VDEYKKEIERLPTTQASRKIIRTVPAKISILEAYSPGLSPPNDWVLALVQDIKPEELLYAQMDKPTRKAFW
jgi:hypothetical protein